MAHTQYIELNSATGFQIKYGIRLKMFLLILTNFRPLNFKDLLETHFLSVPGIHRLDAVGLYDDGSGYMIYLLNKECDVTELFTELEKVFQNYFIDKTL